MFGENRYSHSTYTLMHISTLIYIRILLVFKYMQNCKLFIGTRDAKNASSKTHFSYKKASSNGLTVFDTLTHGTGRKITNFW